MMRQWILTITCGAALLSILQVMLPKNGVGTVGRFAGGLVLLWLTVQPLVGLDAEELAASLAEWDLTARQSEEELTELHHELLEKLIEQKTAAYIQDKASSMGIECGVTVTYEWVNDETPRLVGVEVVSSDPALAKEHLSAIVEEELGISAEGQIYRTVE